MFFDCQRRPNNPSPSLYFRGRLGASLCALAIFVVTTGYASTSASPVPRSAQNSVPNASDDRGRNTRTPSEKAAAPEQFSHNDDFIFSAEISKAPTDQVQAGQPIPINATFEVSRDTSAADVERSVEVLIDGLTARKVLPDGTSLAGQKYDSPSESPKRAVGGAEGHTEPVQIQVSFLVRVPDKLSSGDSVSLALYSVVDGRVLATGYLNVKGDQSPIVSAYNFLLLGLGGILAIFSLLLLFRYQRYKIATLSKDAEKARFEADEIRRARSVPPDKLTIPYTEPTTPELPPIVVDAATHDQLALVLGMGASAQQGLPSSTPLWLEVLSRVESTDSVAIRTTTEYFRSAILRDGPYSVIDAIVESYGRGTVVDALKEILSPSRSRPGRFHERLGRLTCRIVVDTTWDQTASTTFPNAAVFTPMRCEGILSAIREHQQCILKPMGDLRDPDGISLTSMELRRMLSRAPEFDRALAGVFSSHTLLFLGLGLPGLDAYLQTLPPSMVNSSKQHIAVLPEDASIELWQAGPGRRYGIQLVSFRPSSDFHELVTMLESLADEIRPTVAKSVALVSKQQPRLRRVALQNIGAFEQLDVELSEGWTVFLGNNGGGKSTILRAISLALAGNDSRSTKAAGKLLRNKEKFGTISLDFGSEEIWTELIRDGASILTESRQITPLQAGRMLVLAFPVLRGISSAALSGPKQLVARDPSVEDIAPMLDGITDSRLDDLKQWIVNVFVQSDGGHSSSASGILKTLRAIISEIVPYKGFSLSRVDRNTWTIWVSTPDGEVEFDAISQGMSSILNWVGMLLRRLYDVYPSSLTPEQERALVLIDEIDAHLHPNWQRQLVTLTRKYFPNVQVVATTHSPLLAGCVRQDELRIVERDPTSGRVRAERARENLEGQRVEDILTSSLFSLDSTRNPEAEKVIREYINLFEKRELTDDEVRTMKALEIQVAELNYGSIRSLSGDAQIDIDHLSESQKANIRSRFSGSVEE